VTARRRPGEIAAGTTLIDTGMGGNSGITAVFLIKGERTCLVDAGAPAEAQRLIEQLDALHAFPPDVIVVTHPHWDHAQGIPALRREAERRGARIDVMALVEAVPLLADASFNDDYGAGQFASVSGVTPLREGDAVDLGGWSLRVLAVPGHCAGHLALLDERNGMLHLGDAPGYKTSDTAFLPPFMPPCWDTGAFLASMEKLRKCAFERLTLSHFGCISGPEAAGFFDEAVATFDAWWRWYAAHEGELADETALFDGLKRDVCPGLPDIGPVRAALGWLAVGYRQYEGRD